jgi:hypothetical protein
MWHESANLSASAFHKYAYYVEKLMTKYPGSQRIPISGRNNDCMYTATATALWGDEKNQVDPQLVPLLKEKIIEFLHEDRIFVNSLLEIRLPYSPEERSRKLYELAQATTPEATVKTLAKHVEDSDRSYLP